MNKKLDFICQDHVYGVVGASHDQSKYGFKVYQDLLSNKYQVYPINPKGGHLLGNKVYQTLQDIPIEIDVVVMVVPPHIGRQVLEQVVKLGIDKVWFQPGSEDNSLLNYCLEHDIQTQTQACIMTNHP